MYLYIPLLQALQAVAGRLLSLLNENPIEYGLFIGRWILTRQQPLFFVLFTLTNIMPSGGCVHVKKKKKKTKKTAVSFRRRIARTKGK